MPDAKSEAVQEYEQAINHLIDSRHSRPVVPSG